jgi:hypothetical protein
MSTRGLQVLLADSLTDPRRLDALLRGCPTAFEGCDLSPAEVTDLRGIGAHDFTDFAAKAHRMFYGEDLTLEEEPLFLRRPVYNITRDCA